MKSYTYYLYHVPTGKKYYGFRFANKCEPKEDLWKEYFSSSKKVKKLIKEYGKESFVAEVRKLFDTPIEAFAWECEVLRRLKVTKRDDWLNQTIGDEKFYHIGPCAEETKIKIQNALKGRPSKNKGIPCKEDTKEKLRKAHLGKKHNAEHRKNRSLSMKGKIPYNKGKKGLQVAHNKGIPCKEETKEKIRIANTGRKRGVEELKNFSNTMKGRPKAESHKKAIGDALRGKKQSEAHRLKNIAGHLGQIPPNKGIKNVRMWIHNTTTKENKFIEIKFGIPDGWEKGRYMTWKRGNPRT